MNSAADRADVPMGGLSLRPRRFCSHAGFDYTIDKVVGEGAFATVYGITVQGSGERLALKRICEDPRYKSRELEILKMLHHPNCLSLVHHFTTESSTKQHYLNLVTEYVPETLSGIQRQYLAMGQTPPIAFVRLVAYQLLRGLAYLHGKKIVHRDIKPANILFDPSNCQLRLCDFGSAKFVKPGEASISYITSRPYRAPELILGATFYDSAVDLWSAGCVIAELVLGQPLFSGDSNAEQLLSICQVLGTPTRDQLAEMNPNCANVELTALSPLPLKAAFRSSTDAHVVDLVGKLCQYSPAGRLNGWRALLHPFFDPLRAPGLRLPNGMPPPDLFGFTEEEVSMMSAELLQELVPDAPESEAAAE